MQFTLTISLDNAEAAELGPTDAAAAYLRQVAGKLERSHVWDAAGSVRDGNGNTIGQYAISED